MGTRSCLTVWMMWPPSLKFQFAKQPIPNVDILPPHTPHICRNLPQDHSTNRTKRAGPFTKSTSSLHFATNRSCSGQGPELELGTLTMVLRSARSRHNHPSQCDCNYGQYMPFQKRNTPSKCSFVSEA
eukprot:723545-Amphidinium_carterae.1